MNRLLTLVFIAFLGFSCSSIKYTSDQMGGVDFEQYKTYKVVQFVNEEDLANEKYNVNQMNEQRLLSAIDKQASLRGMSKIEEPEMLIIWAVGIDIQKSYETHTDYMGGPYMGYRGRYRYGGYGMASSYSTTQEYETEIGQLKIAVVDPKTKEMLWMGSAEGERGGKVKDADKKINEIVSKIFEMYPLPITE
ncbi:DUF4136 domain-containing protein [Carboxylicivirga sp. M1479]|uniref:DUF4136 domain-containing protein n=1 Tax=Carboxylicivirga sp. M1479 TaxID=2594476 RepID=UPI00117741A2|nr:DUF4136 domain-containing protein [Carboxylicivirga sp. M1479]TRX63320.1 DUF4136 domain-containing protein [Carboxylicivirga sp. M1479]